MNIDNKNRYIYNSFFWLVPLILCCIGVVMIISITSQWSIDNTGTPYARGIKQIQSIFIGFLLMLFFLILPTTCIKKYSGFLWFLAIILILLTLIPGIGVKVSGARRWISIGSFRFQPIEFLFLALIIELANVLSRTKRGDFSSFINITFLILIISGFPLILQPNMSGLILVFLLCMLMHIEIKGLRFSFLFIITMLPVFYYLVLHEAYRFRRFVAFINPWSDPLSIGFQIIQGMVAFANGGLFGVGIGNGLQKMNFLPAAHTDYILATIGEEFGLVGTLIITFLFVVFTIRVYVLYNEIDDVFRASLVWGILISMLLPFFINVGGVIKLMPLTGVPLPFMSYGGSAMIFAWIKLGILMRVNKEIENEKYST